MMRIGLYACAIMLLINTTACAAMSKLFDAYAHVIDVNGSPCFSIGEHEDEKNRKYIFQGISVNAVAQQNVQTFWDVSRSIDTPPFYFQASSCLLYGARLYKDKVFTEPKILVWGEIYEIFLHVNVNSDSEPKSRRYYARFCLTRQPNGVTKVRQIIYDNGWHSEVCNQ